MRSLRSALVSSLREPQKANPPRRFQSAGQKVVLGQRFIRAAKHEVLPAREERKI